MSKLSALYFSVILVCTLPNVSIAQDCDTLYQGALTAFRSGSLDNAYMGFDIARACYMNDKHWEQFGNCSYGMSAILFRKRKYEQILEVLLPTIDTLHSYLQNTENHNALLTEIYGNLGAAYSKLGDNDKAISHYEKGLNMTNIPDSKVHVYNNLGVVFRTKLDYQKAILYYRKTLDILEDTFFIENRILTKAHTLNNLAQNYRYYENYDDALRSFEAGLNTTKEFKAKDNRQKLDKELLIAEYYVNLGALYNDWKKYDKALFVLNKHRNTDLPLSVDISPHLSIGNAYLGKKDYYKAINSFKKAIQVRDELYENNKHVHKAQVYLRLGKTYYEQKIWQQALDNFQQALIQTVPTFDNTSWKSNPDIKDVHDVRTLLQILDFKAQTLYEYYKNTQDKNNLNAALNTYKTTIELIDKIRIEQQYDESAFSLLCTARPIYEGAIEAAYAANQPELAYQFMEKGKAVLLLTALRDAGAKITVGIPDSLLSQEKELKIQISYNERRLNNAQLDDNQEEIKNRNAILFEKREELQKFVNQLEADYPEYYERKYNTEVANLEELQNQLKQKNSTAIEFFMGEKMLYTCIIDGENITLHQLEKEADFEAALTDFLATTSNPSAQISDFKTYTHSAALLYQKLLNPILPSTENILIIPDDKLTYLAFDALIQHPVKGDYKEPRYDTLSYLVNQFNVNYAYSASVLLEKKPQKTTQKLKPFAGFAPGFSSGEIAEIRGENLDSLIHNQREVETIKDIMGGSAFLNEAATTGRFDQDADEYRILHFATHVVAGDTTSNTGHRIHLNDSVLLAESIYNSSLNADLVVLSACETGQGELVEGEGVMSLARAFRYIGCPSLAASLWSVDDKSTADIMIDFYKNIHAQQPQNQALTNSKRNYLQQLNTYEKAHPFYWAGFVHVGDTSTIDMAENSMQWLWWGLGFAVLLGLWRWLK